MKHFWNSLVLTGLVASLAGCSSYGPHFDPHAAKDDAPAAEASFENVKVNSGIPRKWLKPSDEPYRLGPGDQLTIEVVGIEGSSSTTFVTPDGKIYYQNLSGVRVKGMTLVELKETLQKELAKWYRDPQVSVSLTLVKSRRFWVMGRVTTPGVYPLSRPTTVVEALSLAGGLTAGPVSQAVSTGGTSSSTIRSIEDEADLSRAFLIRNNKVTPVDFKALLKNGNMAYNIYLQDGDYIYLPSMTDKEVYVMGMVLSPQAVRFRDDMTVVRAIAEAGGPQKYAHVQHVVIIRGSLTKPRVAVVPYKDIVTGEARDVALEPHDIVWVPRTPWERLDVIANQILSTFARTVAVNEGATFANPGAAPVGTSIPVGISTTDNP